MLQDFPIIFHGVCGEDEREAKSPSFFNTAEIEVVVQYLQKLLQNQGRRGCPTISPKEIGIISPYRKQVQAEGSGMGELGWLSLPSSFTAAHPVLPRWRRSAWPSPLRTAC